MGTSLQAALQEHANGLVFLLVVLSSTKTVILLLHIIERGGQTYVYTEERIESEFLTGPLDV